MASRGLGVQLARPSRPVNDPATIANTQGRDTMHRSTDRILTTHVGSLIRPDVIRRHLRAKQKGEGYDPAAHARDLKETVAEVVRQQAEIGVDVVSDGEFGKGISWSQYLIERLDGFERRPFTPSG